MKTMKTTLSAIVIALIVMSTNIYGQATVPQYFNFYGKAMNGSTPVTNLFSISITIEQYQGGPSLYHEVFTNVQPENGGMYHLLIGSGTTTDNFFSIPWSTYLPVLAVAIDPNNGTSYGTPSHSSLVSVPYSFIAEKCNNAKFINGNAGYISKFNSPTEIQSSSIYDNGSNVGIGCYSSPDYSSKLHVKAYGLNAGYFTNDLANSTARAVKAEYLGTSATDAAAVEGVSKPQDYYGFGGKFTGGYTGVKGIVEPTSSFMYYGLYGQVSGGTAGKAGYGVFGHSQGAGTNYGVYGVGTGGSTNYAGYFSGNVTVTGTFSNVSDAKFKKDIQPVTNALSTLMKLEPKAYSFNTQQYKSMNLPEGKHYGFIAQELESIMPELVTNNVQAAEYNDKKEKISEEIKFKAVNYIELISVMVGSIQEQQMKIEQLENEIKNLRSNNNNKK